MSENTNNITDDEKKRIISNIADRVNFNIQVIYAVQNKEHKNIEQLINPNNHPNLTKEEKEAEILSKALLSFSLNNLEVSFFEYLIFEYKISEDVYINLDSEYKNKIVEDMFQVRRLNDELSAELLRDNNNPTKRPKV